MRTCIKSCSAPLYSDLRSRAVCTRFAPLDLPKKRYEMVRSSSVSWMDCSLFVVVTYSSSLGSRSWSGVSSNELMAPVRSCDGGRYEAVPGLF
jgi:hypothetical protein